MSRLLRNLVCILVFLMAMTTVTPDASASLLTFAFEGGSWLTFTDSPDGAIGNFFNLGDRVSGYITFDPNAPGDNNQTYYYTGAVKGLWLSVNNGEYTASATSGDINLSSGFIDWKTWPRTGLTGPKIGNNELVFSDVQVSSTALDMAHLPNTPPPITPNDNGGANWDRAELIFHDPTQTETTWESGVAFQLDSMRLVPNPVPIPSTMLLLGTGLVGLAGLRKRFRKR